MAVNEFVSDTLRVNHIWLQEDGSSKPSEKDLSAEFSKYGSIRRCFVVKKKGQSKSDRKSVAFIQFFDPKSAQDCLDKTSGKSILECSDDVSRSLLISVPKSQRKRECCLFRNPQSLKQYNINYFMPL